MLRLTRRRKMRTRRRRRGRKGGTTTGDEEEEEEEDLVQTVVDSVAHDLSPRDREKLLDSLFEEEIRMDIGSEPWDAYYLPVLAVLIQKNCARLRDITSISFPRDWVSTKAVETVVKQIGESWEIDGSVLQNVHRLTIDEGNSLSEWDVDNYIFPLCSFVWGGKITEVTFDVIGDGSPISSTRLDMVTYVQVHHTAGLHRFVMSNPQLKEVHFHGDLSEDILDYLDNIVTSTVVTYSNYSSKFDTELHKRQRLFQTVRCNIPYTLLVVISMHAGLSTEQTMKTDGMLVELQMGFGRLGEESRVPYTIPTPILPEYGWSHTSDFSNALTQMALNDVGYDPRCENCFTRRKVHRTHVKSMVPKRRYLDKTYYSDALNPFLCFVMTINALVDDQLRVVIPAGTVITEHPDFIKYAGGGGAAAPFTSNTLFTFLEKEWGVRSLFVFDRSCNVAKADAPPVRVKALQQAMALESIHPAGDSSLSPSLTPKTLMAYFPEDVVGEYEEDRKRRHPVSPSFDVDFDAGFDARDSSRGGGTQRGGKKATQIDTGVKTKEKRSRRRWSKRRCL